MNIRVRQQIKAIHQQTYIPSIIAIYKDPDNSSNRLLFIDPRDWDNMKSKYGDKLRRLWNDDTRNDRRT